MNRYEMHELKQGTPVMVRFKRDQPELLGLYQYPRYTDINHPASNYGLVSFGRRDIWVSCDDVRTLTDAEFASLTTKIQKS